MTYSDNEVKREHWANYLPVNQRLSEVVERLADDLVDVTVALEATGEKLEETSNTYIFPYGRMSVLPPALFGEINEDVIASNGSLEIPTDTEKMMEMIIEYEKWVDRLDSSGKYTHIAVPTSAILLDAMKEVAGREYPSDQWGQSAEQTSRALQKEPLFTMDVHRVAQINAGVFYLDELPSELRPFYRQIKEYVIAPSQLVPEDGRTTSVRELPQIPIGQYGQEAAEKLARAVTFFGDIIRASSIIDNSISEIAADQNTGNILRKHTMRTRESYEDGNPAHLKNGLSDALVGGILSMAQVISFLSAEKVEGYDNFDDLVVGILDSDILEEFARLAPVGYIGPVTLGGIYIPHSLEVKGSHLALSKQMKDYLSAMHRGYMMDMANAWKQYDSNPHHSPMPRTLGLSCPASEPHGAIATLRPVLKSILVNK